MSLQISVALVIFVATIATSLLGLFASPKLLDRSLFRPYWFLRRRQYDTVIMSGFVHADLMHLIFNMMTFYFFGFMLERAIRLSVIVAAADCEKQIAPGPRCRSRTARRRSTAARNH